jgi:hypothetical protein
MQKYFDEIQQWYIIFLRREKPRTKLHHYLVCDDFAHVFLVRENPNGGILAINPSAWGTAVSFFEITLDEYLCGIAEKASAILSYTADYRRFHDYVWRQPHNCVSVTKAILGLTCYAQLPKGLYKHLMKSEATTVVKPFIPYLPKRHIL